MSKSSELHSYLAEDAIQDTKNFLHHLDYTTAMFDEFEVIECIEQVARSGYFHCCFGYADESLAIRVQDILRKQHFLANICAGNILYVSWEPDELAELK